MTEFFLNIVNMSISASWIVLAVLLLRLLLKKAPKWIAVLLWGIVAVRLICPISVESALSLIPSSQTINPEVALNPPAIDSGVPIINNVINPIIGEATITLQPEKDLNIFQFIMPYLAGLWVVGITALLIYTSVSYVRIKKKIGTAIMLRDNIFQSENIVSPFVLGIIKPKIYLPFRMNEQDMEHVIAHEQAHICRKDHWWKPLGFLILTLHWFNPLMWLGYALLCRDIELACDEKVIKELNTEQKADYSQALLTCSVNRRMIAACPLAFGEVGVKDRVKSVLNYKKPAFWMIAAAMIASAAVAVCFLTNPKSSPSVCSGFTRPALTETGSSIGGISVTLESAEIRNGKPVLNVRWSNFSAAETGFGLDFQIYRYENGIPVDCCTNPSRIIESIARLLPAGETAVVSYDCSDFDFSRPGRYRFETANGSLWFCFMLPGTQDLPEGQFIPIRRTDAGFTLLSDRIENPETMVISSAMHLPVFRLETVSELQSFIRENDSLLFLSQGIGGAPSFSEAAAQYDSAFFVDCSLALVWLPGEGGSDSRVLHTEVIGGIFGIALRYDDPQSSSPDTCCRLCVVPVEKSLLAGRKLDAWYVFDQTDGSAFLPDDSSSLLPPG